MKSSPPINRLPPELLRRILDKLVPDPERTVPIDDRRFLSVESFDEPPPSDADWDLRNFRNTCRRFAEVGDPLLFTVVAVRFSKHGLEQLEKLAAWPKMARHVKKFTYMVPYYYPNAENLLSSQPEADGINHNALNEIRRRLHEQKQLLDSKEDVRVLKKAFGAFVKLPFVKLLRVADSADVAFKEYVQGHDHLSFEGFVDRYWTPACSRGSFALGRAMISTNAPCSIFYSPVLSIQTLQSTDSLELNRMQGLSELAARTTCLTIVFEDGDDLDQRVSGLSNVFGSFFATAQKLESVHVGFPRHHPLRLPLEAVFHNVTWSKLRTFGVAGWNLDAEEIIDLAIRHRETLKGLRLRDVHLKEGSSWKEVLGALRSSMPRLEWVSLRRIGYVNQLADLNGGGAEVPDDPMLGMSTSESDEADDEAIEVEAEEPNAGPSNSNHHVNGNIDVDDDSETHTNSDDDERGPEANDIEFPYLHSPDSPTVEPSWPRDGVRNFYDSLEDLGDNGESVSYQQRKAWEKWVLGR